MVFSETIGLSQMSSFSIQNLLQITRIIILLGLLQKRLNCENPQKDKISINSLEFGSQKCCGKHYLLMLSNVQEIVGRLKSLQMTLTSSGFSKAIT